MRGDAKAGDAGFPAAGDSGVAAGARPAPEPSGQMADISGKRLTARMARARAVLAVSPGTLDRVRRREVPKGDVLEASRVAALQAAKDTPRILPFCHTLPVHFVGVEFTLGEDRIAVETTVKTEYGTGVEMEALTAASVAALNLWDMLKPVDAGLRIVSVELLEKRGGKSDVGAEGAGAGGAPRDPDEARAVEAPRDLGAADAGGSMRGA
jgi:cyclic pyranopterin monophosphate synthase